MLRWLCNCFRSECAGCGLVISIVMCLGVSIVKSQSDSLALQSPSYDTLTATADTLLPTICLVGEIIFIGNSKTKKSILLREMDIKSGDTLAVEKVESVLEWNKNRIFNTGLFITVEVQSLIKPDSYTLDIVFILKERWYIFPLPIFELGDRSFNEWWYQRGRDLSRTNYGIHFEHKNFRGRNERLRIVWQEGFTPKYELGYFIPYLNKKQKAGLGFSIQYAQNKQIAAYSENNKLVFIKSERNLRSRTKFEANYTYRQGFFLRHQAFLRYRIHEIADTVSAVNPNYFSTNTQLQQFAQFTYQFVYDKRDVQAYALNGHFMQWIFDKSGLLPSDDVDFLNLHLYLAKYQSLGKKWYFSSQNKLFLTNTNQIPYFNLQPLGFGRDYIRGYDLNVIDATSYLYTKSTLKKRLFRFVKEINKGSTFSQFKTLPLACYLTSYFDAGYTHNPMIAPSNQKLLNTTLAGYGIGLDFVTFYDTSIRLEYSFNPFGQSGLYFYFSSDLK